MNQDGLSARNTALPIGRSAALLYGAIPFLLFLVAAPSPLGAQEMGREIPSLGYHLAFTDFFQGEYRDALDHFQDEGRGARKWGQARWIDSICYNVMIAECYYHMGQLENALDHYSAALELFLAYPTWMIRVQFPNAMQPAQVATVPWGVSSRRAIPWHMPNSMLVAIGQINVNEQIRRGGVVVLPSLESIRVQEIVRCTTLAIRRRTELLGPLSQYDRLAGRVLVALQSPTAPPNHWSQAWADVQLGCALVAAGKDDEAVVALSKSIVAAGQFDHALTPTALFELGQLALKRSAYPAAKQFFLEASISGVQYADVGIVEESLAAGAVAHMAANDPGVYPPLVAAGDWARVKRLNQLQTSMALSLAENLAVANQTAPAAAMLDQADLAIGRRWMRGGRIGARLNYLRATVAFQRRDIPSGNAALAASMDYMRGASHWNYQIAKLDQAYVNGQVGTRGPITGRGAMELFSSLLRDPLAGDWALKPMEALSVLVSPHSSAFEHWFLIAWERNEHEAALEIADRARRHRFFNSLAFGGRLQSLRWILEAPDDALGQAARLDRQTLLGEYPAYDGLMREARLHRAALEAGPLVVEGKEAQREQAVHLAALAELSLYQEAVLREVAVRRDHATLVFPPQITTKQMRQRLPDGHSMLVFFAAGGEMFGFLLDNKENYHVWRIKGHAAMVRKISSLLREMGHYEQNRELSLKELADDQWKETAAELLKGIMEGSRHDFSKPFPELVIVPDGVLWYVPFEALQVEVDDQTRPLIDRCRVRYAPTVSLAVPDGRGRGLSVETAVVSGRLYPRNHDDFAAAELQAFAEAVPRTVVLPGSPLPAPSSVYASLFRRLVVLDDLYPAENGPYSWSPIQTDRGKPGNTLNDWLSLPWGGPREMILPGYHTTAESALKRMSPQAPGAEVFLSVCGMMSSGARTILLSRWRCGGKSSYDFVREFTQELSHLTPAEAHRRAVMVVASSPLDLEREPRLKRAMVGEPPTGKHPFFWSGFMLIDSGQAPPVDQPDVTPHAEDPVINVRQPEDPGEADEDDP